MKKSICWMTLSVLLTVAIPQFVFAHARLKASAEVAPRSTDAGIKTGPCGGLPRTTSKVVRSGATIQVQWEETINHPGRYEFYFSPAGDTGFQLLLTVADVQDGGGLPHQYTANLTLPNIQCTNCTLQMIQVMTENPNMPTYYYSCADMTLSNTAPTPTPAPSPTPTPVPTATPVEEHCH